MYRRETDRLRCVIMRGGTSKAVFFKENDIPKDSLQRDKIVLAVFGSPDSRQIDGLGGADPLTSKLAIIGPPSRPDADVDYTFGQVEINKAFIDYSGICGNISAAVGPFAIEEGLVRAVEPLTRVRIYNTNTKRIFVAEVPVADGQPRVLGDYRIDGVPGTGSRITLDMAGTAGGKTGKLLPTGSVKDFVKVEGLGEIPISIVDVGNPTVFVHAKDLGLVGTETPREIDANKSLLSILEKIRAIGAEMAGVIPCRDQATEKSPAIPMIAFVAPPRSYVNYLTGETIEADAVEFLSRLLYMQITHKTYAGSCTVATGAAAVIPGTVVYDVARSYREGNLIRIGHPGGIVSVEAEVKIDHHQIQLTRATYSRTARRIMEGYVYVPTNV